jgi:hypothetical protein
VVGRARERRPRLERNAFIDLPAVIRQSEEIGSNICVCVCVCVCVYALRQCPAGCCA